MGAVDDAPADNDPGFPRADDRAATEQFVRDNIGWMLAVARRVLRDAAAAEDAVQGAFVSIFKNIEAFEGRSALKTWMHRIVVNEALMLLRRDRRLREEPIDTLLPTFDRNGCRIEGDWATFETPESAMQRTEARQTVAEVIDRLPDGYRIVLLLRDIEEMSTADVAAALDLSEANVKVRLHRARAALKKLLEPMMKGQML